MVSVFGVTVPEAEGRVGMAAVTMESGRPFDPKAFFEFTGQRLPNYAQPAFVRIKPELELTGTFKMTKTDLNSTGFNPELVDDPIYFREQGQASYVPVDKPLFDRIQSGDLRV